MARITGTSGNDTLTGTNDADAIEGRGGADTINGLGGNDTLQGGAGNDKFRFEAGGGKDTITDLAAGDTVEVSGYGSAQSITQVGTSVVVVFSSGDQITFSKSNVGAVQAAIQFDGAPPITGTYGDDTLTGTNDADTIYGLDGRDTLYGLDGNDTIDGGSEDDLIYGGAGDDIIYGGWGGYIGDRIYDGEGNDKVYGGLDQDTIHASAGDDYYDGGTGLTTGFEWDVVTYRSALAGIVVDLNLPSGQIRSSGTGDAANIGVDTIVNVEIIEGSEFDDVMTGGGVRFNGGGGNDVLTGGANFDVLAGGAGNDTLDGGAGDDLATYDSSGVGVNVSLAIVGAQDTGQGIDSLTNIEGLEGSDFDDTLIGDDNDNYIYGRSGYDILIGGGGADQLLGRGELLGGEGNDIIYSDGGVAEGGAGDDKLYCGAEEGSTIVFRAGDGKDTIKYFGDFAPDTLVIYGYSSAQSISQVGLDVIVLLSSGDQLTFSQTNLATVQAAIQFGVATAGDDTLTGTLDNDTIDGLAGNDTISGDGGNDILIGGAGADTIDGGAGIDLLIAGAPSGSPWDFNPDVGGESDTLFGGAGDDVLDIGFGDNADGGSGTDTLRLSLIGAVGGVTLNTAAIVAGGAVIIGGGTIQSIESISYLLGTDYADNFTIAAQAGGGAVHGGGGNDVITSTTATVTIYGDDGDDTLNSYGNVSGGNGNDTIGLGESTSTNSNGAEGGAGDDSITGNAGNNSLSGDSGADTISGGDGDDFLLSVTDQFNESTDTDHDVLNGGAGNDYLAAGYGDDVDGGIGFDNLSLSLAGATSGVTLDTAAIVAGQTVMIGVGTIQNIESVDYLIGSSFADNLTIATQSLVNAGDGDDVITVVTTIGSQTWMSGGNGNDRIVSGAAADLFDGAAGIDTIDYRNATSGVTVNLGAGAGGGGDQLSSIENVDGSAFADNLTGDNLDNMLSGAAGNDKLEGLEGDDLLDGGTGNDILNGAAGNDTMTGGSGNDLFLFKAGDGKDIVTDLAAGELVQISGYSSAQSISQVGSGVVVILSSADQITFSNTNVATVQAAAQYLTPPPPPVSGTSGNDNLVGTANADQLLGLAGNDTLDGLAGNDILDGGAGNDRMKGGAGDDIYYVDSNRDDVTETTNAGTDEVRTTVSYTLRSNVENAVAEGIAAINLTGNSLSNMLTGNSAANTLNGGAGADTLKGGQGNDVLTGGLGADRFVFETGPGSDRISDFQSGVDKIDLDAFGISLAQVKATASGGNTILSIDSNSDGLSDFTITLTGAAVPTAADYIF